MLINATPSAASSMRGHYTDAVQPKKLLGKPGGENSHVRFARTGDMRAESCSPMAENRYTMELGCHLNGPRPNRLCWARGPEQAGMLQINGPFHLIKRGAYRCNSIHRRRVQRRECCVPQGASFHLMCGASVVQLLALVRQNATN
jgi:hypothetical protein